MAQKTTKKKSTTRRRKRKTSFWRRLLSATNHKALYIGVAVVLVVYAFFSIAMSFRLMPSVGRPSTAT